MNEYWYLATPYSKYPRGLEAAFALAALNASLFAKAGIPVYSPIAHTHSIAAIGEIDPYDHKIWMPFDEPMMCAAKGLVVLKAESWEQSYGMRVEIEQFTAAGKPVIYMTPGELPPEIIDINYKEKPRC